MSSSSDSPTDLLLSETAWLRKLSQALLGCGPDADDLSQDAVVAALQRQPEARGTLRPWLRTVAARLHVDRQRAQARRRLHESRAARAEPTSPATADTVARFELGRKVTEAVYDLEEPYRSALLLRYYEDLPPRLVAERMGVPVETARTRIKRALSLLRGRLDRGFGQRSAWSAPLASAFGLRAASPATIGATTALGAFTLMSMKPLLVGLAIAAAITATVVLRLPGAPTPWNEGSGQSQPPELVSGQDGTRGQAPNPNLTPSRNSDAQRSPAVATEITAAAIVRGRCVDPNSRVALGGCEAVVTAQGKEKPLAKLRTGDDGRFDLSFQPKPGSTHYLWLAGEGRITLIHSWERLVAGARLEMGDLELARGSPVHGTVRDQNGVPQPGVRLQLNLSIRGELRPGPFPRSFLYLESDEKGSFATPENLLAGEWFVKCFDQEIVSSKRVAIPGRGQPLVFAIVTYAPGPDDLIEGVLVDDEGEPLPKSWLGIEGSTSDRLLGRSVPTDEQGRFRVVRPTDEKSPAIRLRFERPAFELSSTEAKWGQRQLRISVRRGLPLEVQVVHAGTGKPVRDFGVEVIPATPGRGMGNIREEPASHEGGLARVAHVRRGPNLVVVHPSSPDLTHSVPARVQIAKKLARVVARVHPLARQKVQVLSDERPVAGSLVQLLHCPEGIEVDATWAFSRLPLLGAARRPERTALVWSSARTDAQGHVSLPAPAGLRVAVRVTGEAHVGKITKPFVVRDGEHPLQLRVERGTYLSARLYPLSIVRAYRMRGAVVVLEQDPEPRDPDPRRRRYVRMSISDKGEFERAGLGGGTWRASLHFDVEIGPNMHAGTKLALGKVGPIALGQRNDATFNLANFALGTLEGRLLVDGQPAKSGRIFFFRPATEPGAGARPLEGGSTEVDASGAFELELSPGEWTPRFGKHEGRTFEIEPGQRLQRSFSLPEKR